MARAHPAHIITDDSAIGGKVIEKMYEDKDWDGIEDYIRKETKCAIETYRQLLDHMKDWKYVEK